jgi:hypothetical protein
MELIEGKTPGKANSQVSKSAAFIFTMIIMVLFGAAAVAWPDRAAQIPAVIAAIGGMGTFYIGLQIANNGVKGKYWNSDMHEAEMTEREKGCKK